MEPDSWAALQAVGGELLAPPPGSGPGSGGIRLLGWVITARVGLIIGAAEIDRLLATLGTEHLPEMVYSSWLSLRHEATGVTLQFEPTTALREWLAEGLPPAKVPTAEAWTAAHRDKAEGRVRQEYDWTFTTPYAGAAARHPPPGVTGEVAAPTAPRALVWRPSAVGIDRAVVLARDPILWSTELVLYESDLGDAGHAQLGVKLRVMPTCWYLLLRFYARVDGALVRLRESRVQCCFGAGGPGAAPVVHRERQVWEESIESLRARGAPTAPANYASAQATAETLASAGGSVDMFSEELVYS